MNVKECFNKIKIIFLNKLKQLFNKIKKLFKTINKKHYTVKIIIGCVMFLLLETILIVYFIGQTKSKEDRKVEEVIEVKEQAQEEVEEKELTIKEEYEKYKKINDDYIGQIYFESGLLDLPFVQGETNDTYLRTDFETMKYSIAGTVFMDCQNNIEEDQNIILYGHNYSEQDDPTFSKMFSSLRLLKDQANYEDNKIICLYLGDKTLRYQVLTVYEINVIEQDGKQYIDNSVPQYTSRNYISKEFNRYQSKYKQIELYDTELTFNRTDKLLTLQTCVDGSTDKLIVVAKLIETVTEE